MYAIAVALAASAAVGALNGVVIATLRIQPFIVTLATMIGIRGLAKWLSGNANIDIGFGQDVAADFAAVFRQKAVVIGSYACARRGFLAGADQDRVRPPRPRHRRQRKGGALRRACPSGASRSGSTRCRGLLAGLAGVLYAAENHQGNPNAGVAYELDAIAAVVIGGTRLTGGKGSISGTIVGTLIMGVLTNMLRLNNVDSNVEMMIKAVIIVLAVAIQGSGRNCD